MNQESFIHTFIPGTSSKVPTLLLLHGTGGDEHSLVELGQELLPGANLLSPRGKVREHGNARFFRRLSEGVFDIEDLHKQTSNLKRFIGEARIKYDLKKSPFFAIGYSNGANIAASLLMTYPGVVQGAVLFRAMLPFHASVASKKEAPVPVLLLSGEHDHLVNHETVTSLERELEKLGMNVDLHWIPTGHQLNYSDVVYAKEWLTKEAKQKEI